MQPIISDATLIKTLFIGPYEAVLFGDIKAAGIIQYTFLVVAYDENRTPIIYIGSEWNPLMERSAGHRSHFLGVFAGGIHSNYGSSDDWQNPYIVTHRAILEIHRHFGIEVDEKLSAGEVWAISNLYSEADRLKADNSSQASFVRERIFRVVETYRPRIIKYLQYARDMN